MITSPRLNPPETENGAPMTTEPQWSRCLVLAGGLCPRLAAEAAALAGRAGPRPELSQDLALLRLARACAGCALAPEEAP